MGNIRRRTHSHFFFFFQPSFSYLTLFAISHNLRPGAQGCLLPAALPSP
jgi:hypothetical protein